MESVTENVSRLTSISYQEAVGVKDTHIGSPTPTGIENPPGTGEKRPFIFPSIEELEELDYSFGISISPS